MLPSLFISHGSPMLALHPGASGPALAGLANRLPRPKAIVVVSAHRESRELLVTSSAQPETWHDFYGFPPALYAVQYPAPGAPSLAGQVSELLKAAGLPARLDAQRPFDHGAWVPLSLMYPDASIPVVQVSLPSHMGPALQVKVGQALASLRAEGILLVGSGSITHNLGELDWHAGPDVIEPWALAFRDWVVERLQEDDQAALLDYRRQAPYAVRNHPSDEHLLPLFFALGAGGKFGVVHQGFTLGALGMDIYRYRGDRERRAPLPLAEGRVRCRTALGARDGIAAKNLLGAILNEGGLARDAIGRIQVRDSFSLVELPEDGLEKLLSKLKDTRVAGKQLKLRRYRED